MAQPQPYNRQFNFADQQALTPSTPLPGTQVDAELNAVKLTFDQTLANLAKIQRDDGALKNGIVTQDSLSPSLSIGFTMRGEWAAPVNYYLSDGVSHDSKFYRAKSSHLSVVGQTPDMHPELWDEVADFTAATAEAQAWAEAAEASATEAANSVHAEAQNGDFTPEPSGVAVRTLQAKNRDILTSADFGMVGDNSTNNDAAIAKLKTWLEGATASAPRICLMLPGIFKFETAFAIDASYWGLRPLVDNQTTFRYAGANTTNDVVTFGNASTQRARIEVGRIYFDCDTTMSAGALVRVRNVIQSHCAFSVGGQTRYGAVGRKPYNGTWFDAVDNVVYAPRELIGCQNDGLLLNGTVGAGAKADFILAEGGKIALNAGNGVHIGGGFGGFYCSQANIIQNGRNLLIDTALCAEGNREIFFGAAAALDSALTEENVLIDDSLMNGSGWIGFDGTWIATTVTADKDNVRIASGYQAIAAFNGGTIYNSTRDGIRNESTSVKLFVNGTAIRENDGYGVNNTVTNATIFVNDPFYTSNALGNTSDHRLAGYYLGNNGEVFFGLTGQRYAASGLNAPRASIAGFSDFTGGMGLQAWVASNRGASLQMLKSRGAAVGTFTIVQNGDELGRITFAGADGSAFARGAQIRALVNGTPGAADMPTDMVFDTSSDGSGTPVERFRVKNFGQVRFQPLSADPATLEDGDVWYNSTAGKLRVRAGGVTFDLH